MKAGESVRNAIGLIETVGLAGAIDAADAAVKSANVELIGMEYTKGDGMVVIKIEGDVGAVKAGIESARQSASKVCRVFSYKVIPRPSEQLEMFLPTEPEVVHEVEAFEEVEAEIETETTEEVVEEVEEETIEAVTEDVEKKKDSQEAEETKEESAEGEEKSEEPIRLIEDDNTVTCNICNDPKCTRKKGQVKRFCIHYFDRK